MKLSATYQEETQKTIQQNGDHYYAACMENLVTISSYNRGRDYLLQIIHDVNEAHLVMLAEQGIVTKNDAKLIMETMLALPFDEYRQREYSGKYEDIYFEIESDIVDRTGGVGSNLHLSRSRNDMCTAWAHLEIREHLLNLIERFIRLQNTVRLFAEEHKDTLYVAHTHTQHAQPSVFGHYFLGFADVLDRCVKRLRYAYDATNVSPMGGAALTTSGYPVSRERVAALLGFDGIIENAFDCIGNADHFLSTAAAINICAVDLGRVVTDFVLWATEEMNMIRLPENLCGISSIMPQKRNPIVLEHLRSSLGIVKGQADAIVTSFKGSPYGDISDYEDMKDTFQYCCDLMEKNLDAINMVVATMEVNTELLRERAFESFSVVTELADEMYRSCSMPFRKAHGFVHHAVHKARETNYNLKDMTEDFFKATYEEYFNEPFTGDFASIKRSLDPEHFVKIRETMGGTGKTAMANSLISAKRKVDANAQWYEQTTGRLAEADKKRAEAVAKLIAG